MNQKRLKAVILADHLYAAYRIWRGLRGIPGVDYTLFICNNRRNMPRFILAHAYFCLFKIGPAGLCRIVGNLCRKKIALRFYGSPLNAHVNALRALAPDVGLHAMDTIYRREAIDCFQLGILNPHIGKLPEFRGRCVMEWSLLYGAPTGVTTFFIDAGIDTGKELLFFEEVPLTGQGNISHAKQYLFSKDVSCFRKALLQLQNAPGTQTINDLEQGRRYYVMSECFKGVVEQMLEQKKNGD